MVASCPVDCLNIPDKLQMNDEPKIFRVSEITRLVKTVLEDEIGEAWVQGEISNIRMPSSGHLYFTLKDETAQLSAVMFRGAQSGLRFKPSDGMQVNVFGFITVYERGGQYQIIVRRMNESGQGALQARFEALKKKLDAEGLFDAARKKSLPVLPARVGVVTSPTGAAVRDILNVISRRFNNLNVLIAPAKVQGEGSAEEIAGMIDYLNQRGGLDVIIVGRGGGSVEDLWAFNEECVARAIAASRIPVISAVGHETDFTISDFVADLRAPTPSAAAELVTGRKKDFEDLLASNARRLRMAVAHRILEIKNRFAGAAGSYVFREPRNMARNYRQILERHRLRVLHAASDAVRNGVQRVDDMNFKITGLVSDRLTAVKTAVQRNEFQLKALNPLAVLERGYSITMTANGDIIRSPEQTTAGELVKTRLARGVMESEVIKSGD